MVLYHHVFVYPTQLLSLHLSHLNPLHHAFRAVAAARTSVREVHPAWTKVHHSLQPLLHVKGHNFNIPNSGQRFNPTTSKIEIMNTSHYTTSVGASGILSPDEFLSRISFLAVTNQLND
jgi:hypothetical protein